MAAATEDRNTHKRGNELQVLPVAAATKIPAGVLAAKNAAGYAVNAADAANLDVIGRANHSADNAAGANGDISVEIERGVFNFDNDATDAVTIAHVGAPCYVVDNQTVSSDPQTHARIAGNVHAVDAGGVWVDTWATLRGATGPTGPTGPTGE